ncbi:hypothetical protein EN817_29450 [Mesorhizobium sp. M3A.F.Ca.ET.174.01.1.1]|uniref:hypothetical protein n=1 Tax=unclassified Mesorhizobium TaxID=325217 RepID=UPI0010938D41|nr:MULTISPECIES: hypothetical protein [unclassified Mesorhizobium]TGS71486.1 hypothetical protein EN844_00240 [Mesorhizobium sp. M3A.F.Ca.ET.201.01.1.1]TGS82099.1 hypothetical protein EN818_29225 [Mesorhizobium sp. M3A.F.Ca.ET.175.01.1.1]TGT21961.1 hypothetical protein EN817_29450 [Mesorhizobium sp. M3A.F.Ca.ET.174.01.1.1]
MASATITTPRLSSKTFWNRRVSSSLKARLHNFKRKLRVTNGSTLIDVRLERIYGPTFELLALGPLLAVANAVAAALCIARPKQ